MIFQGKTVRVGTQFLLPAVLFRRQMTSTANGLYSAARGCMYFMKVMTSPCLILAFNFNALDTILEVYLSLLVWQKNIFLFVYALTKFQNNYLQFIYNLQNGYLINSFISRYSDANCSQYRTQGNTNYVRIRFARTKLLCKITIRGPLKRSW